MTQSEWQEEAAKFRLNFMRDFPSINEPNLAEWIIDVLDAASIKCVELRKEIRSLDQEMLRLSFKRDELVQQLSSSKFIGEKAEKLVQVLEETGWN